MHNRKGCSGITSRAAFFFITLRWNEDAESMIVVCIRVTLSVRDLLLSASQRLIERNEALDFAEAVGRLRELCRK